MITLDQIAKRADVSRMTVSNVLNRHYNPKRRDAVRRAERIRRIAREMGYLPNAAARAIQAGRFGVAALLLSTKKGRSTVQEGLLTGLHDVLASHDMRMEIARFGDEALTSEESLPKLLRELSADGLLIDYTHSIPAEMVQIITDHRLPAVWINSKHDADCVRPDDFAAGQEATRLLLSAGHIRIGYVDYSHGPEFPEPHYSTRDRREGYASAMRQAGLAPRAYMPESGTEVPGVERIAHAKAMLQAPDRPTALITYSAAEAAPVYAAAVQLAIRVPDELSLVNIGENPMTYFGAAVTTMIVPHLEVGRLSAELFMAKVADREALLPPQLVAFGVELGETIRSPHAAH